MITVRFYFSFAYRTYPYPWSQWLWRFYIRFWRSVDAVFIFISSRNAAGQLFQHCLCLGMSFTDVESDMKSVVVCDQWPGRVNTVMVGRSRQHRGSRNVLLGGGRWPYTWRNNITTAWARRDRQKICMFVYVVKENRYSLQLPLSCLETCLTTHGHAHARARHRHI